MTTIFPLSFPAAKTKKSSVRKGDLISSKEPEQPLSIIAYRSTSDLFYGY